LADEGAAYAQRLQGLGRPCRGHALRRRNARLLCAGWRSRQARAAQELACMRLSSALRRSEES
jgi:hypothetical protein